MTFNTLIKFFQRCFLRTMQTSVKNDDDILDDIKNEEKKNLYLGKSEDNIDLLNDIEELKSFVPADLHYPNFRQIEASAVPNAIMKSQLPTPSGKEWDAICKKYNLPKPVKVDNVMSEVILPDGWKLEKDNSDPFGRIMFIKTDDDVIIGKVFIKNTGYDYYGYISFNIDNLIKLGIMSKSD